MLLAAVAIVAPAIGVATGFAIPHGDLSRARRADLVLGPGRFVELDLGLRFWSIVTPHVFAERTWFDCGEHTCGGSGWMLGGGVRIEAPLRRTRPFLDLGLGQRTIESAHLANDVFENRSYFLRGGPVPRSKLSGIDYRVSAGVIAAISRSFELALAAHVSIGRSSSLEAPPNPYLDAGIVLNDDRDALATHAFYGLSLAVRFAPQ